MQCISISSTERVILKWKITKYEHKIWIYKYFEEKYERSVGNFLTTGYKRNIF